jgi:hypothetical protein
MNKELHAQAFTHGSDIYFNEGKYNPASNEGKQLLAHELTHVVQQTGAVQPKSIGNKQRNQFQRQEGELEPLQAKKLTDPTAEVIQNKTELSGNTVPLASRPPEAEAKQNKSSQAEELISHSSEVKSPPTEVPSEANAGTEAEKATSETNSTLDVNSIVASDTQPDAEILSGAPGKAEVPRSPEAGTVEKQATSDSQKASTTPKADSEQGVEQTQDKAKGEHSADKGSSQDAATTEKGAKDEATASPSREGQTEAVSPKNTSATAANEAASMVDNAQAVTEQEKTTVEQQAAQAKAEMDGEIASMKAEPLPSLAELLEPGQEGTGEEIDSIVPPSSSQPELQLPTDTASLTGSGEGSELTLPTNLGNQSNFASANATSSQVASNKFKPDLYEASQSSRSTVIQMDSDPAAQQNPDTGYSAEAARSAVRGIAGTIEASSEQARQSIQAQTETVSATLTANAGGTIPGNTGTSRSKCGIAPREVCCSTYPNSNIPPSNPRPNFYCLGGSEIGSYYLWRPGKDRLYSIVYRSPWTGGDSSTGSCHCCRRVAYQS